MLPNLNYLIEQIGKDKGISKESIIQTLEEAMVKAAQKKYNLDDDIEAQYNEELGEVELFLFKLVVEEVADDQTEIALAEAVALDEETILGDSIGIKLETEGFGRIAAQVAKQVIIQRVRNAERERIFDDYKDRKGELIAGTIRRIERGNIVVDLGRTEGILLTKDQSPREQYHQRDRLLAYVLDVSINTKGPQIILSRSHEGLIFKLFEMEVPEIAEGIVKIVGCAREPGSRTKIAVSSRDTDVDPVGACVGMKGTRVQTIVQELRGEKIDIVTWNPDPVRYVCNALAPAIVSQVLIDEEANVMEITVPDDQLSLAIGKRGQNVRLASQLTTWKIDIQSESKVEKMAERAREVFQKLEGIDEELASTLTRLGFLSLEDLFKADIEDLQIIPGLNPEMAEKLAEDAQALQEEMSNDPALKEEEKKEKKKAKKPKILQPIVDDGRPELMHIKGVDEELTAKLKEAGYYSIADLLEAEFEPKTFCEKFEMSMRKSRNILHSLKRRGESIKHEEMAAKEAPVPKSRMDMATQALNAAFTKVEPEQAAPEKAAPEQATPEEVVTPDKAEDNTEDGDK